MGEVTDPQPQAIPPTIPMIAIKRYGRRNWAVYLGDTLLVVALYKKGAVAVRNALQSAYCLSVVPTPTSEAQAALAA